MSLVRLLCFALALAISLAACSDSGSAPATPPAPTPAPVFRHQNFYQQLQADADAFHVIDGDWVEDYGDAPFYGLAFYAHNTDGNAARAQHVERARARARNLLDGADFLADDLQEITMSAFGLIEYADASGDDSDLLVLDRFIERMNALVGAVGWYLLPETVDSWALRSYGSTAISALIGLINAEYALRIGGEYGERRKEWAAEMARRIVDAAHDGSGFAFGPDRPGAYLYPNVAMILLDARLHLLTGDESYRQRALGTYQAIQALRLSQQPARYQSPYSAEAMGATTDDYTTLSSHNYLMLALAVLFELTRDPAFVEELDSVVDGMEAELYDSWCFSNWHDAIGCTPNCNADELCVADVCEADSCQPGVLHHWMDGRIALPADPEYFCSGCNLQLLYVMWYRQTRL